MKLKQVLIIGLGCFLLAVVPVAPAYAGKPPICASPYFLTLPAWYRGLQNSSTCEIVPPGVDKGGKGVNISSFLIVIALNVIEIMIQAVAYISVGYIVWGGYLYLASAGQSQHITRGRKMIQNALIGLVLSVGAVFITSYFVSQIGIK